jgi:hypothetical protein
MVLSASDDSCWLTSSALDGCCLCQGRTFHLYMNLVRVSWFDDKTLAHSIPPWEGIARVFLWEVCLKMQSKYCNRFTQSKSVESQQPVVARQWLSKHTHCYATDQLTTMEHVTPLHADNRGTVVSGVFLWGPLRQWCHATMQESETVFSIGSVPRLYKKEPVGQWQSVLRGQSRVDG